MFVIAKHHELLRRLGLDTMEGVKNFKGELIKNHKGQRDIQRVRGILPDSAQPAVLFLKRNWRPYRKDGLKSLLTRGRVWSQSRVEWENSLALQRAGIGVAEPLGFGEECGPMWENFSFIITAAASGERTIEEFLRDQTLSRERRPVLDALALWVRKMHAAGLASPDLFTRHIFVHVAGTFRLPCVEGPSNATVRLPLPVPQFCLIDMARLDRRKDLSVELRARDLAALNVTAPMRFVNVRERLRFLKIYGGDKRLLELVLKRTTHLLTRRKFSDFTRSAILSQ